MPIDVGAEADLAEGGMRGVEEAGEKILLARIGGRCHAVGGTCPHAGAPLSEGVLHGEVVTCPWHKAAFNVTTGRRVEPPAMDDLPRYETSVVGGRVLVEVTGGSRPEHTPTMPSGDDRCMAIVGAGAAGAMAAQTLREAGFAGRVVLIGQEDRVPYDRTVLSKYALSGKKGGEKTPLQDQAFYDRHAIERVSRRVASIDPATRSLTFGDGTTFAYHAVLAATGGAPRRLETPGAELDGVFVLRSAADAEAIADAAAQARSVVIAGSGFIAMEAAASLCERGLSVTVVAPQSAPFERQLGAEVGRVFQTVHEREGIVFRLGDEIVALDGRTRVEGVRLKSGGRLQADLVVVGLGITPATEFIGGVTRTKDGGILVDRTLRAADGLYAAGDIAAFPLRGDGETIRVEHWRVAEQHGRTAALNMLGHERAYDSVPYFWTIHFMKRLDYVGHAEHWDEIVLDGDREKPDFTAFYLQNDRVAAIAGWGRDKQMATAITLMTRQRDWSLTDLRQQLK